MGLRIFFSKIVYRLKFQGVTCYIIDMNNVEKVTFRYPTLVSRFRRRAHRSGQTLVEYGLILAIVSVVAIGVLISLGKKINGVYSIIDSVVASAQASH